LTTKFALSLSSYHHHQFFHLSFLSIKIFTDVELNIRILCTVEEIDEPLVGLTLRIRPNIGVFGDSNVWI